MNDVKNRFINWFSRLSDKERREIMEKISDLDSAKSQSNFQKNQENYIKQKVANNIRGEKMKKKVKVGMFVKCRGTKDGIGLREVLEVDDYGIQTRKITKKIRWHLPKGDPKLYYWIRDSYITSHGWDKVKTIIDVSNMEIQ